MTSTTTPASNPELPLAFGAGSAFGSRSCLQPFPFNQAGDLATDETRMEHGLGTKNCFSRPGFYSSTVRNQFDVSMPGFRHFPICVCSVFHLWLIELPRLQVLQRGTPAVNPFRLIGGTRYRLVVRWPSKNIGYYKLLQAIITWRRGRGVSIWSKINSPSPRVFGGARLPASHPDFQPYFARN